MGVTYTFEDDRFSYGEQRFVSPVGSYLSFNPCCHPRLRSMKSLSCLQLAFAAANPIPSLGWVAKLLWLLPNWLYEPMKKKARRKR
jgi:hypothetical protein